MRRIKETYLIFVIIMGLLSLSIYSTYALFTEEYVVGSLDINTKIYNISLSNVIEYKRINTYSNNQMNITLNILNPTINSIYYGLYTSSLDECVEIIHDGESASVKDIIDSNISKTINIKVNNSCSYNYSFNLYVLTGTDSFDNKDKVDDKIAIKNNSVKDEIDIQKEEAKEEIVIKDNTLVSEITSLYDTGDKEKVTINDEDILYNSIVGLMKDSYDNIRYYGEEPNNYIELNNELWRIIGIFKIEDNYKIKIIKNDNLSDYVYGDVSNNFKASTIMKSINPNFSESNKYWNSLDDSFISLLDKNNYYLGSVSLDNVKGKELYDNERDTKVIWNGYLGLMYPSDYAYSKDLRVCSKINDICDSYLNSSGMEYTISGISDTSDKVFGINNNSVDSISIDNSISIRPVGYLKSNIIFKDGNGTQDNPYIIG